MHQVRRTLRCPWCGQAAPVQQQRLVAHRAGATRCIGTGQPAAGALRLHLLQEVARRQAATSLAR